MKINRSILSPAIIWSLLIALGYLWVVGSELQCAYSGGSEHGCDPKSLAYFLFPNSMVPILADAGFGRFTQFLILAGVDAVIILLLLRFWKAAPGLVISALAILGYLLWSLLFGFLMAYLFFSHAFDIGAIQSP